jgi:hypothetical protein
MAEKKKKTCKEVDDALKCAVRDAAAPAPRIIHYSLIHSHESLTDHIIIGMVQVIAVHAAPL